MKRKGILLLTLVISIVAAVSAAGQDVAPIRIHELKIMESIVTVKEYEVVKNGLRSPIIFVSLHHDEQVGLRVVKQTLKTSSGRLFEIVSGSDTDGRRLVDFRAFGKTFRFDPNRIFSDIGLKRTVGASSGSAFSSLMSLQQEAVLEGVKGFRSKLLDLIKPAVGEILVTVHNNKSSGEPGAIEILSFFNANGLERKNTHSVYVVHDEDRDDLIMVSNLSLFAKVIGALAPGDRAFNIGVQKPSRIVGGVERNLDESDGYLSVFAAQKNYNYIVVEAEHRSEGSGTDHSQRQKEIIDVIMRAFPPR